jgi:hypothetical protein
VITGGIYYCCPTALRACVSRILICASDLLTVMTFYGKLRSDTGRFRSLMNVSFVYRHSIQEGGTMIEYQRVAVSEGLLETFAWCEPARRRLGCSSTSLPNYLNVAAPVDIGFDSGHFWKSVTRPSQQIHWKPGRPTVIKN